MKEKTSLWQTFFN